MGEANGGKRSLSGLEKLSLETSKFPRDLLQGFMASNPNRAATSSTHEAEDESEEIELNLGLSLGGRFGVDKTSKNKLVRSSSIAGSIPIVRDDDAVTPPAAASFPATLMRTSSLPAETEEDWRKRKEMQMLRRMEAKRRRSEKQKSLKSEKDGGGGGGGGVGGSDRSLEDERRDSEVKLRRRSEKEQYMAALHRSGASVALPFGLPTWPAAARQAILSGGVGGGMQRFIQPAGSVESQGGSSSGLSESESRPLQGSSSCGEASPASTQSWQERSNPEAVGCSGAKGKENTGKSITEIDNGAPSNKRPEVVEKRAREAVGLNAMEEMPCVFTQGDGPSGRRVDGILYKYGKGEEVRIMCVCHGSFLSPAEFVKHAGGTDVANPLKHIVVNPSSV